MSTKRLLVAAAWITAVHALAGCVVNVHEDQSHEWIRRHASQNMNCPMGQLTVHHNTAAPHRKRVVGCGQDVTYVEVCKGTQCDWVREGAAPPSR